MTLFPLYAIVDEETATGHGWTVCDLAKAYLEGGARLLQVRVTEADSGRFLQWCDEIVEVASQHGAQVIINDRADIARLSGAAGVHVGQGDLPVWAVRRVLPEPAIVGLSTHTDLQVDHADAQGATYIAVGPTYPTFTKDTGYEAVGPELVRRAVERLGLPVVAIGGITLERTPEVIRCGAASVAVISDLLTDGDPARRVADYVELLTALSK